VTYISIHSAAFCERCRDAASTFFFDTSEMSTKSVGVKEKLFVCGELVVS